MLTVIVAGRNDDYGKDFRQRLFRTSLHNSALFEAAGIDFEYMLAEWNPLPHRPALSEEFVDRVPNSRAVIIPREIHDRYTLNPRMPFHEMAAKNAALRRARGDVVAVTNADILFSEPLVQRIAAGDWEPNVLYRAHRIDVKPNLEWKEIQNPANQLPSGEGTRCPPYYLGAGGDFCLALREVWHSLRGFNETIRFSTRAKDWQFFLSATAQDMDIEFIGNVYHLDHDGGFRNTHSQERNSDDVHFGKWWDIEFGLPVTNRPDWGFSGLREHRRQNDPRTIELEAKDYIVPGMENRQDREMIAWLTRRSDLPDTATAVMLHAICAAFRGGRRLICPIQDAALAVTLSGFESVASRFGVEIHCNWNWPSLPGYTVRPFRPEPPALREQDWILEETEQGVRIVESGGKFLIDVLPRKIPINEPEFNPVLARRLLYAYLRILETGKPEIAIYGAGSHTRELLRWGIPDDIRFNGFVESDQLQLVATSGNKVCERPPAACGGPPPLQGGESPEQTHQSPSYKGGEPPQAAGGRSHRHVRLSEAELLFRGDVAVLLSSASFESDMLQACHDQGIHNVIALYSDWPRDLWKIGAIA